jgi:hypothetical protein
MNRAGLYGPPASSLSFAGSGLYYPPCAACRVHLNAGMSRRRLFPQEEIPQADDSFGPPFSSSLSTQPIEQRRVAVAHSIGGWSNAKGGKYET